MGEYQQLSNNGEEQEKGIYFFIKGYWILILSAVFFIFIISFVTATVIVRVNQPKIVTFDLKSTTDDFVQKTAMLGKKATPKDVEELTAIFKQSMQDTLDMYERQGYIVMVKPAVMKGAKDITDEVRENIYRNIRGEQ
ncbi:TrbI F-type domain-containing protein [Erwinia tasmaniensis]|uniref:Conjugative transfer protein n=1 Tax=Erwinia tasmaniensis (strain DSM 17950 / CFBP 7177 / CIP 109463 / NCPPB 4357 / Et1/99) TaxID=465817 RepID=B2VB12_ERWT9|nr:TrbI F-type domain-containing protein [Erwinia tasmaniensis]CAO94960.1 Conjugative transfer protein [Erwinia tasmaniensis Et1/99]